MARFKVIGALAALLTLGAAGSADAGIKLAYPVGISRTPTQILFSGAPGTVRGDGTNVDLGCYFGVVSQNPPDPVIGGMPVLWCSAVNATDAAACTSTDAGLIKMAMM